MTAAGREGLPPGAYAAGLAALPGMGPATLARLLGTAGPADAWDAVLAGEVRRPERRGITARPAQLEMSGASPPRGRPQPRQAWADVARSRDLAELWASCCRRGIGVTWLGGPDYPAGLVADPEPPGVLFWRGRLDWLERPCVAVVGTRRCTPDGRAMAFELGRDLANGGVCVVSGLALGIDGAAHTGALEAGSTGPVGVAASGVDRPYPPQHRALWERLVAAGALLSETPPGSPAQSWRFPARNRVIAGLVRMVVVVESHATGGSLITAEAAIARGIDVRAVPGPVRSPASAGSNQLLYDGPSIVRHAGDVLDGIGIFRPWPPVRPATEVGGAATGVTGAATGVTGGATGVGGAASGVSEAASGPGGPPGSGSGGSSRVELDRVPALDPEARRVLDAISWRPTSLGQILERSRGDVGPVARTLAHLEDLGLVSSEAGWWTRRR